jgi:hypothetical protein
MKNEIIERLPAFAGMNDKRIREILQEISVQTGFCVQEETQRRMIYTPDKVWQSRTRGMLNHLPMSLKMFNLKPQIDSEWMREEFRKQAMESRVRPPMTYRHAPFNDEKGFGYTIDEFVDAPPLFEPTGPADIAAAAFVPLYRELRNTVRTPFWKADEKEVDAAMINQLQMEKWLAVSRKMYPNEPIREKEEFVHHLATIIWLELENRPSVFTHAHLSGSDVRHLATDEYVVYCNKFWRWNQPGYDVAFPIWNQWLALPDALITPANIRAITDTWLATVAKELQGYVDVDDVRTMLLNRIVGSLLLDLPAQTTRRPKEVVECLRRILVDEAERIVSKQA